jgi:GNAT superfamily N-acetyltransferase
VTRKLALPIELTLREVDAHNLKEVLAITLAPQQDRYVDNVEDSLQEARDTPEGRPWYRAVYDGDKAIGFVMLSWNVEPDPPEIIGPWYLWKLIVDQSCQGRGHGRAIVKLVAGILRAEGATELLTSYATGAGGPGPFYERVGFVPTGDLNVDGEVIMALPLRP